MFKEVISCVNNFRVIAAHYIVSLDKFLRIELCKSKREVPKNVWNISFVFKYFIGYIWVVHSKQKC